MQGWIKYVKQKRTMAKSNMDLDQKGQLQIAFLYCYQLYAKLRLKVTQSPLPSVT